MICSRPSLIALYFRGLVITWCSQNFVISHSVYCKLKTLVILVLSHQYLCILAKNSASYAHFLFSIFVSEFGGGSHYMKQIISQNIYKDLANSQMSWKLHGHGRLKGVNCQDHITDILTEELKLNHNTRLRFKLDKKGLSFNFDVAPMEDSCPLFSGCLD